MAKSVGKGEGKVNLIAWAGYVEDGSTDPKVDWVTDFEKETGCEVNVKIGNTSDEMVTLMRTGQYDGVSASGDATLRLIAGGDVAPVKTDLVKNYNDVFSGLKDRDFNPVDGQMYGIPHGRGANLLMWNSDKVSGDLTSWDSVFDTKKLAGSRFNAPILQPIREVRPPNPIGPTVSRFASSMTDASTRARRSSGLTSSRVRNSCSLACR